MRKEDLKIVFFGTPEFAVGPLSALVDGGYKIAAVVTMPDKPAGRNHRLLHSEVKKYALEKGLPLLQPVNLKDEAFVDCLRSVNADLFIVIAFRMLPQVVWAMPRLGTFNLHASLLPRYRGAAPINWAIINGDKETGVTTFFLKHEIDTGDIIAQEKLSIGDDENVGSLYDRLMSLGTRMVRETVDEIIDTDGNVQVYAQPEGEYLPAPKIFTETCDIDWTQPREKVRNLIRGLSPYPAAHTRIQSESGEIRMLKIFSAESADSVDCGTLKPGDIVWEKHMFAIMCADGLLKIGEVQLQGKKRMSADAFMLGYKPVLKLPFND